ncbi:class I SAM-dependent methyltransferase [uncultured Mucilaginibacter sp.]|uniref:class I SAM-dependent DNA methyltransferase n=1 Tax=uncultured Mucilaginibacter sp. TaxID=797541 RepID=UPI0025DAA789|nr:class I SAM-dependent methyltransferase [uncultured Mucilaginibacter sp.]
MLKTVKKYISRHFFPPQVAEREVVDAYDLWAENYDSQPGNLMLDLDKILFSKLIEGVALKNKVVADIGCGTGRHWPEVFKKEPASLTGFDISPGMLNKLKEKFPVAETYTITENSFSGISDHNFDVLVSTLTVAHIENLEEALEAWCRITKDEGDIIITDFHPDTLAFGGKRTFKHGSTQIAVRNFVHTVNSIKEILLRNGFKAVNEIERKIDESVKHYYTEQNAALVYEKFKGFPVIYGIHFRRR